MRSEWGNHELFYNVRSMADCFGIISGILIFTIYFLCFCHLARENPGPLDFVPSRYIERIFPSLNDNKSSLAFHHCSVDSVSERKDIP